MVYVVQLHPMLCHYAQRGAMFWQKEISLFLIQMRHSKCRWSSLEKKQPLRQMYGAKFNLVRRKNAWNSRNYSGCSEENSTIHKVIRSRNPPDTPYLNLSVFSQCLELLRMKRVSDSGTHLWWPLWAFAVVLQEAAAVLGQPLDHLQPGQVLLLMKDAHAPLLQRRGHREHVSEATVPWHRCWHRSRGSNRQHVFFRHFSERSVQTRLDSRFSSVFNFTESEWQIPSPCPPLAFKRSGRGERVTATVSSGNIWWARQTQKGSFENSRKRENVRVQEWAGWVWKVEHLLGWRSVKCVRKYTRSLTRVLNDKYLFCCLARLNTLINVK